MPYGHVARNGEADAVSHLFRRSHHTRAVLAVATAVAVTTLSLAATALASTSARPTTLLRAGQIGSRASVPWRSVGPGWDLAAYSATSGGVGSPLKPGPVTLYLVDPLGGRYTLDTWSAHSAEAGWILTAWSGDGQRALFTSYVSGSLRVHQLVLRTGTITSFTLPVADSVLSYTRPDGLNVLVERDTSSGGLHSKQTLLRYNLRGQLQKTLASVEDLGSVAYQPAGLELAAGALTGLVLIGNTGGVIRNLPVPGASGCSAVRWWSASTILASCDGTTLFAPRMWLVPAGGARPTALTPIRKSGEDEGDFNAWQLSSGLYVDALGPCGVVLIGKQPAHGPEKILNVPGSVSSLIVTATRTALLVHRSGGCEPGSSLIWLNPASGKYTVAVPAHGRQYGVVGDEPWFVTGKF
jgi:hypothetical protein